MATAPEPSVSEKLESNVSSRAGIHVPEYMERLLLSMVLLALAILFASALLSSAVPSTELSNQTEFKLDVSTRDNQTKSSTFEINITTSSSPLSTEKSNRASVAPLHSLTSLSQEGVGNIKDRSIKDETLTTLSVTKDVQDKEDHGERNYNKTIGPRDKEFHQSLANNENYIQHELREVSSENLSISSDEEEGPFVFRFVMFTLCIGIIYTIYLNKKRISLLFQCRKLCFKTEDYSNHDADERMSPLIIIN